MLYEKYLDAVLQDIVARWDIPGLVIGIVEDGKMAIPQNLLLD